MMIDCRAEQPRNRERFVRLLPLVAATLVAVGAWGVSITGSSPLLFASLPDSTDVPPIVPDMEQLQEQTEDTLTESRIVPGPTDDDVAGLTVGERLKRLDSLMLVVPPDSLEPLMAAYEELLDSALRIQYSGADGPSYGRESKGTTSRSNAVRSTPRSQAVRQDGARPSNPVAAEESRTTPSTDLATAAADGSQSVQKVQTASDRESAEGPTEAIEPAARTEQTTRVQQIPEEPVRQRSDDGYVRSTPRSTMRSNRKPSGLQPEGTRTESTQSTSVVSSQRSNAASSEPTGRSNSGHTARTSSAVTSTDKGEQSARVRKRARGSSTTAEGSRTRTRADRTGSRRSGRAAGHASGTKRTPSESLARRYTEGLALFRAGKYQKAIDLLSPVARASSRHSRTARYYLALSLERTGNLRAAMKQYRLLKGSGGVIGEKSWVSLGRLMAQSGNRAGAQQELRQFTRARSSSRYAEEATALLGDL